MSKQESCLTMFLIIVICVICLLVAAGVILGTLP